VIELHVMLHIYMPKHTLRYSFFRKQSCYQKCR